MNISRKVQIIFLAVLFFLSCQAFGLKMTQMPETGQTKNNEPHERGLSLKLPLLQPEYHWTFMSKADFLSGKLVLRIIRGEKNEEIVIFEKGKFSDGWKEMSEQQVEGRGEIYFGFVSTKKYLTAPNDKLELELTVTKDLPGIGAEKSGILPSGIYKSTGTYSGLLDDFESSALGKQLLEKEVITEEEQKQIDVLRSAIEYKAFLEDWKEQWSLNITSQKGWLTDEQLFKMDQARSRRLNSVNESKPDVNGIVLDEQGKPVSDASVVIYPQFPEKTITNKDGKFSLYKRTIIIQNEFFDQQIPYLVIRQRERNLAAVVKYEENKKNQEIQLSPGVIASGKIVDVNDKGIRDVKFNLIFRPGNIGYGDDEPVSIDADGNFQIKAIPSGYKFSISAEANDYGRKSSEIYASNNSEKHYDLGTIVLPIANMSLSGIVVDIDGKPVPDARLTCTGDGQRYLNTTSDENGKYKFEKLIPGLVSVSANKTYFGAANSDPKQYFGNAPTEAGATNVRVVITEAAISIVSSLKVESVSLINKQLPLIENLFKGFMPEKIKDKNVLVCFWDYEQRPSRNCILELTKKTEQLKEKDIEIIAIQSSKIELEPFDKWIQENNIPFTIGAIPSDQEKTQLEWGVKSLPWLILTDKNHKVTAEGFGIAELDEKIGNN